VRRIDRCINWAVRQCEPGPPYRMLAKVPDPIGLATLQVKPDVRHTFALAIILLRYDREHHRTAQYVALCLKTQQQSDGGWLPADPKADSAVMGTLYGVELLSLASTHPSLDKDVSDALPAARDRALEWLFANREPNGLWSTGVFRDRPWDSAVASAWVLHRLMSVRHVLSPQWAAELEVAAQALVRTVENDATWAGLTMAGRFRNEVRAAAALRRLQEMPSLSHESRDAMRRYLGGFSQCARQTLRTVKSDEVDVGSAAFAVWAFSHPQDFPDLGRDVLAAEAVR
jgi:hypothetical protein